MSLRTEIPGGRIVDHDHVKNPPNATEFLRADGAWATPPGTGGVSDGDKGDITVSGGGTDWGIDPGAVGTPELADDAVTFAKIQNVTDARLLGRAAGSAGDVQELTVGAPLTIGAGAVDFDETAALGNNARVTVRKNSGADVGTRRRLNLIEGSNITLTVADDAGSEEVDVTIAASGGGGGGNVGTATIDFGAFPGGNEASVAVTGQAGIVASSIVDAWLRPVATFDHSADEHYAESPGIRVIAMEIVTGVGFTIRAVYQPAMQEPLSVPGQGRELVASPTAGQNAGQWQTVVGSVGGKSVKVYGQWIVAWSWS